MKLAHLRLIAGLVLLVQPLLAQRVSPPLLPDVATSGLYRLTNAFPLVTFDRGIVGFSVPPGRTNELYYYDRPGRVWVITNFAAPTRSLFLDLTDINRPTGDGGMVGMTFHPNHAQNRYFYAYFAPTNFSNGKMYNRLSRFESDPSNPLKALRNSEQILFDIEDESSILHNGGDLHFGADGYLYVTMGDEGGQGDQFDNSQRIDKDLYSSILRLDVDGRPGSLEPNPHYSLRGNYRIPPDNPYIGATSFNGQPVSPNAVRTEFWAVGFRSPHRMTIDSLTGEIYLGDVGGDRVEEVDRVVRAGNHGWGYYEANLRNPDRPNLPPGVNFIPPLHSYGRTGLNPEYEGRASIGGLVYRGTRYPELYGKYIFGDYISKHIWAITFQAGGGYTIDRLTTAENGPTHFGLDPATGEILIASNLGIVRLVRNASVVTPAFPPTLSAVGAFSNLGSMAVRSGVMPYQVTSPFWSDHAIKQRWFFFQDATSQVTRSEADQWSFPSGMVWMKHFDLEMVRGDASTRRRIETRFTVKTSDAIYGLTYRWRPDGSNADLVPESGMNEDFVINEGGVTRTQTWRYPSRSECLSCHNRAAGYALGFSTRQLNRDVASPSGLTNQLSLLSNLGVFAQPVVNPQGLPRLAAVDDTTAPLEHRFKSYLDANCAYCHQPFGPGRGTWDGRQSTPLDLAGLIDGQVLDTLGIPDARVIKPGSVDGSILWQRIANMGVHHMPPLATGELNTAGVELVRSFILNYSSAAQRRTVWQVGSIAPPGSSVAAASAEFGAQNFVNDAAPGRVTRLPGDPQFVSATNPGPDDDFYFGGYYVPGFNNGLSVLTIPNDEPATSWEAQLSTLDRTNRIHFTLDDSQVDSGARLLVSFKLLNGSSRVSGVVQPGFGLHDILARFKNGVGVGSVVYSSRVTQATEVQLDLPVSQLGATAGPNTVEIVRTGPDTANSLELISFDYVRIESVPAPDSDFYLNPVSAVSVDESTPLSLQLRATTAAPPVGSLVFALVSGPSGLTISPAGVVGWTPSEAQGPSSSVVLASVTDSGTPTRTAYRSFSIQVNEVSRAPVFTVPVPVPAQQLVPYVINLVAEDTDIPANAVSFALVSGPAGLTVGPTGVLSWTPTDQQVPAAYPVVIRMTDNGTPPMTATGQFSIALRGALDPVTRTDWRIGTDNNPAVAPYSPSGEFSVENGRNDLPPGAVTRLAVDPLFAGAANPTADDDFYFAGVYPPGFNGLQATLGVPNDEPPSAWERAHSLGDRTNRLHFVLGPGHVTPGSRLRFSFELLNAGFMNGTQFQPGFGDHDMVVRLRNRTGAVTELFAQRVSQATNIVIELAAATAGALAGANSIELVRVGPAEAGMTYWIQYDFLRLESIPGGNTAPVLGAVVDPVINELSPYTMTLVATDGDLPLQTLTYGLVNGPSGLGVSAAGVLSWTPTEEQGPGTYSVTVQVTDNGTPSRNAVRTFDVVVNEVADAVARSVWQIGTDNNPVVLPYSPIGEFSIENGRNDLPPGVVTRLAGDPLFAGTANPTADDDFYFAGNYPVGFNGLLSPLSVSNDEPPAAWERAHTAGDRTNRVHLVLTPAQVTPTSAFQLSMEFVSGGSFSGGAVQPGFGDHDMVVRFRNGTGVTTELFAQRVSQSTNLVIQFPASLVGASAGGNSVEIVRNGPAVAGVSYWIQYDYLRLEARAVTNTPPLLATPSPLSVDELVPLSLPLAATDGDLPAQTLTYALVSGPAGVGVSLSGALTWTPTELQGPGTYPVTVRVMDNGTPAMSAETTFPITVREVNVAPVLGAVVDPVINELSPYTMTLVATDGDLPLQTLTYGLVNGPSGLGVSAAGVLSWTPTEEQGPGTYSVTVQVTDNGTPSRNAVRTFDVVVNEVADAVARSVWQIGTDNNPVVLPYSPIGEFSIENGRNDLPPGVVTRLAGDPLFAGTANPTADDDFYFAGNYPVGFNGLLSPLSVSNDEPPAAWERAHTAGDRTNRVHLVLTPAQVTPTSAFQLSMEFVSGGSFSGGAVQPGFGDHDMVVRFRNGTGVTTELFAQRVSQSTNLVIQFPASLVGASAGGNSVEIVRNGPAVAGVSYWIQYDYLRLEARAVTNTPPLLATPLPLSVDELVPLSLPLAATDGDLPAQTLTYALVSGPAGVGVSLSGALTWTPTELQGPGTYPVAVRVMDNGTPAMSAETTFPITVREVNVAPVLGAVVDPVINELSPYTMTLVATDGDLPLQTLTYGLVNGPSGLGVSAAGVLSWTPTEEQGPGTYSVTVQVTDNGTPSRNAVRTFDVVVNEVADAVARSVWQIGTDNNPVVLPYSPIGEFSIENGRNDLPPGVVTRLAGDPLFAGTANPTADDDFYFAGNYPVGFNGLLSPLSVSNDEPPAAWERAHTAGDRTNRVHLVLTPAQVTPTSAFQLSMEFVSGGSFSGGAVQPGFGDHDMVVRFRNGTGVTTELFAQRVSQSTNLVIQFPASLVGASAGGNSVEIVRNGPAVAGVSYWIQYDYLRLESISGGSIAPVLGAVVDPVINELSPYAMTLVATDGDLPAQILTFGLVNGPAGLAVSTAGVLSWTPTEEQGPGTYPVTVQVTDNGTPSRNASRTFNVVVNEVAEPVARSVWQIGTDNNPVVSPYSPSGEFSIENGRNDLPPGVVTRLAGDPFFAGSANPTADDDFYFAGNYPVGFNGLLSPLSVTNDEPPAAWERAHTAGDRTNRVHLVLTPAQVTPTSAFQLSLEFPYGGTFSGGAVQPGFGDHDMAVRFRNGAGVTTELFAQRVSQPTNLVLQISASLVEASVGGNSLEIVRSGPAVAGASYWINYDYLRLEARAVTNTPPLLATPSPLSVDELVPLSLPLVATDGDLPAQTLTYALVSGPTGLKVSSTGLLTWLPAEIQGPSSNSVSVSVWDNGTPPATNTVAFTIIVREVGAPRALWEIGTDAPPNSDSPTTFGEFGKANSLNDSPPGFVTRRPGDYLYVLETNPEPDDDYYFAGTYPAGFNALSGVLEVFEDEDWAAWERVHTLSDKTNRFHFQLDSSQVTAAALLRLTTEFPMGGVVIDGVPQTAFSEHDMLIQFRNGSGVITPIFSGLITSVSNVVVEFLPTAVQATTGGNSIELVRMGPALPGRGYYIQYDFVRLEAVAVPPLAAGSGATGTVRKTIAAPDPIRNLRVGVVEAQGIEYLALTFECPEPPIPGLGYRVEASDDLQQWTSDGLEVVDNVRLGEYQAVTVRDATPLGQQNQRFLRLRIVNQ